MKLINLAIFFVSLLDLASAFAPGSRPDQDALGENEASHLGWFEGSGAAAPGYGPVYSSRGYLPDACLKAPAPFYIYDGNSRFRVVTQRARRLLAFGPGHGFATQLSDLSAVTQDLLHGLWLRSDIGRHSRVVSLAHDRWLAEEMHNIHVRNDLEFFADDVSGNVELMLHVSARLPPPRDVLHGHDLGPKDPLMFSKEVMGTFSDIYDAKLASRCARYEPPDKTEPGAENVTQVSFDTAVHVCEYNAGAPVLDPVDRRSVLNEFFVARDTRRRRTAERTQNRTPRAAVGIFQATPTGEVPNCSVESVGG